MEIDWPNLVSSLSLYLCNYVNSRLQVLETSYFPPSNLIEGSRRSLANKYRKEREGENKGNGGPRRCVRCVGGESIATLHCVTVTYWLTHLSRLIGSPEALFILRSIQCRLPRNAGEHGETSLPHCAEIFCGIFRRIRQFYSGAGEGEGEEPPILFCFVDIFISFFLIYRGFHCVFRWQWRHVGNGGVATDDKGGKIKKRNSHFPHLNLIF